MSGSLCELNVWEMLCTEGEKDGVSNGNVKRNMIESCKCSNPYHAQSQLSQASSDLHPIPEPSMNRTSGQHDASTSCTSFPHWLFAIAHIHTHLCLAASLPCSTEFSSGMLRHPRMKGREPIEYVKSVLK